MPRKAMSDTKPPKTQKSRSISIEADGDYVQHLAVYAAINRTTIAKMTREALDKVFGEALKDVPQPK